MSNASDLQSPIIEATTTTCGTDNDVVLSVEKYTNDENAKKYLAAPVLDDDANTNQALPPATFETMHISGGSDNNNNNSTGGGDYVFPCSANQQGEHPQQLENEASNSTSTTEGSSDSSNGDGGGVGTGVNPERGPLYGNDNNENANNIAHPPPAAVFVCDDEAQHAVPAATMHLDFSALHAGGIANDQKGERAFMDSTNNGPERNDDQHSTPLAPLDALFPTVVPVVGTTTVQGFSSSSSQPPQSYVGGQTASRSNDDIFAQQQRGGGATWKTISVSTCPATPSPRMLSSGKASLAELILDDQHFGSGSQHQLPYMQRQQPPQHPHARHHHCQQHQQQQIYDQQQHSSAVLHPTQTVAVAPPMSLMHKSMMDNGCGNGGGGGFVSTHGGGPNTYEELLRQEQYWQQQSVHRYQAQQQLPHAAAADGPLGAVTDDMSLSSGEGEYRHQNGTKPHSESSTSCNSDVSDVGSEFSPDDDDDEETSGSAGGGGGQWNFWDNNKKPLGSYMLGN